MEENKTVVVGLQVFRDNEFFLNCREQTCSKPKYQLTLLCLFCLYTHCSRMQMEPIFLISINLILEIAYLIGPSLGSKYALRKVYLLAKEAPFYINLFIFEHINAVKYNKCCQI